MAQFHPYPETKVHNGADMHGMLIIDYLFHLPSMVSALVLAYCFFSLLRERDGTRTSVR